MARTGATPIARARDHKNVVVIAFAVVVLVRALALLVLHVWSVHKGKGGFSFIATGDGDDGAGYFRWAQLLANGSAHHHLRNGYPTLLSGLMRLGLDQLLTLKIVNSIVGLMSAILAAMMVSCVVRSGVSRRHAQAAAILVVGLYPTNVFLAANSLLRDVWIIAALMAVAWLCGRAAQQFDSGERTSLDLTVFCSLPLLVFVAWFRPYAAGVAVLGLIAGGVLAHFVVRRRRISLPTLGLSLLAGLCAFFLLVWFARGPLDTLFGRDALRYRESRYLVGGSSLGLRYHGSPLHDLAIYLYSFVSNAFGPLPWQVDTPAMLVPMLLELPAFVLIVTVLVRRRGMWPPAVTLWCSVAVLWLAALGVWNDNLGAALRLRTPAWILLAVSAVAVHHADRDTPTSNAQPTQAFTAG